MATQTWAVVSGTQKKRSPGLQWTRSKRDSGRYCGAMESASKNVHLSGTEMPGALQTVEQLSEKQELLATLKESKKSLQKRRS